MAHLHGTGNSKGAQAVKAAEHKAEAERLVKWAFDCDYMFWSPYVANTLAAAQVHATLANIPDPISSGLGPL